MVEAPINNSRPGPSVFISYAHSDTEVAAELARRLTTSGIEVWSDTQLSLGENWAAAIEGRLRAADYLLVLVSRAALSSQQVMAETSQAIREYTDRAVTVIPVVLENVEMPFSLAKLQYVDFRGERQHALDSLVSRLSASVDVDFSKFTPQTFEALLEDVLINLGFTVEREASVQGKKFDFRASVPVRDPFGALVTEQWFIEAKHHHSSRVSVQTISEFMAATHLLRAVENTKVALITSGQITSAGRELVRSANLRVVEGVELKRILMTRTHLIAKHLGSRRK